MKVPWKIVGLAGVAGVTAATGVVVARKRRDHTEYDPDELRDRLHSRVADAADDDSDTAVQPVDEPAPSQASAEADTAVQPVDEPAPSQASAEADTAVQPVDEPAPSQGSAEADTAVHTAPHGDKAAEAPAEEPTP